MITEDYCSFEISKLLKEKEFDEICYNYYDTDKECKKLSSHPFNNSMFHNDFIYSAPTFQMTMKWLREVYHIAINIGWGEIFEDKFQWWCIILNLKDGSILRESEYYATYEEACEAAIKYCLEKLI